MVCGGWHPVGVYSLRYAYQQSPRRARFRSKNGNKYFWKMPFPASWNSKDGTDCSTEYEEQQELKDVKDASALFLTDVG